MCEEKDNYQSLIDKIKKLKTLSERGEPFERESARTKMNLMLSKYDIKWSEIENPDEFEREIPHGKSPDSQLILCQVIWSVKSNVTILLPLKNSNVKVKKYNVKVNLSTSEYVEVLDKYKHYWAIYKKQKQNFNTAFCHKYSLYSKEPKKNPEVNLPNEKDMGEIHKMMYAMPKTDYVPNNRKLEA
jgi:hypothetical protein